MRWNRAGILLSAHVMHNVRGNKIPSIAELFTRCARTNGRYARAGSVRQITSFDDVDYI